VSLLRAARELIHRVDGCVHFAPEPFTQLPQRQGQIGKARPTHDHEIDVAGGELLAAGDRTVDEGEQDSAGHGRERLAHDIRQPCGLCHQSLELRQDRAVGVRLVIDVLALTPSQQDSGLDQVHELTLKTRLRQLQSAREFARIPRVPRLEHHQGQDPLSYGRNEGVDSPLRTHNAYL